MYFWDITLIYFRDARSSISFFAKHFCNDSDCVLVPEFICRELTDAMRKYRIEIQYYSVSFDQFGELDINIGEINFGNVGVCVIVNYFGRLHRANNNLIEACVTRQIKLIEDDTHILHHSKSPTICDVRVDSRRKILGSRFGSAACTSDALFRAGLDDENAIVEGEAYGLERFNFISDLVHFFKTSLILRLLMTKWNVPSVRYLFDNRSGKITSRGLVPIHVPEVSMEKLSKVRRRLLSIRPSVDDLLAPYGLVSIDRGASMRGLVWRFWYMKTRDVVLPRFLRIDLLRYCELCSWPNLPSDIQDCSIARSLETKIVCVQVLHSP